MRIGRVAREQTDCATMGTLPPGGDPAVTAPERMSLPISSPRSAPWWSSRRRWNKVPPDYRVGAPQEWTWPPGRIDQWGMSDKDMAQLGPAERRFRFKREWS